MIEIEEILTNNKLANEDFKVPKGYFDDLTYRIMANIPKESSSTKGKKAAHIIHMSQHTLWRWAAACACVFIVGATVFLYTNKTAEQQSIAQQSSPQTINQQDDAMSQAADYAMIDNQDMYQMLAEE